MPQDKDFKRLVRRRMAETGERYTKARLELTRRRRDAGPSERAIPRDQLASWIHLMSLPGVPGQENEGFEQVQALPPEECRRVALRGLRHASWRVRRRCAQLLDDLTLTDETISALTAALRDSHPGVRQAALHSLICEHCKPDGCALDVAATAKSMLTDPSSEVRRQALGAFWFIDGDDVLELLRHIAATDRSSRARALADQLIRDKEARLAADAARAKLPEDLRRKTERHPGKWVAIADGRIVSAQQFRGRLRRDLKGTANQQALVVWVAPTVTG
jgi:hypothetical protein